MKQFDTSDFVIGIIAFLPEEVHAGPLREENWGGQGGQNSRAKTAEGPLKPLSCCSWNASNFFYF